jgi:protein Mpv17
MGFTCHHYSANTARRRTKLPLIADSTMLIAAFIISSRVAYAYAFMPPSSNSPVVSQRTLTSRTRGRIRAANSFGLFASVTEHTLTAAAGEAQDAIITALNNDTVPYFMSLDDTATDSSIATTPEVTLSIDETNEFSPRSHLNGADDMMSILPSFEDNQQDAYPSIAISFDAQGMVQADAMVYGALPASYDQDYPALIKFLYKKDDNGQTVASKLFNLALLAISFSYVFFSVFNIDKGMTRGWTPGEISLRIPLDTWASYENSLSEKPVATKTIINVVIYLLGDWLSQTLFQGKNVLDFDAARTIKNGFIGMCFGPAVHEYYEFSDWILPVDGDTFGITNRAFKILMDQTIYLAVKCSIYIVAIGVLNGETVGNSTENVKNRLKPIMFAAWRFWPLVHCVTYGLIPARHRILWVNSVDLVWNAILASKARDDGDGDESKADKDKAVNGLKKGDLNGVKDLSTIMKEVAMEMEGRKPNSTELVSTLPTEEKAIGAGQFKE